MKKLLLTLITLLVLPVVPAIPVKAADVNFWTSGGGTFYPGQTVNVTVSANSGDTYNAVTVNVTFNNLTYLGSSVVGGWTGVAGPSVSGNTVSFSGALLGGTASGGRDVLAISFALPNSASQASVSASGTIALADGSGTPVNGGGNTATYNIIDPPPPPEPAPDAVNISSETHPDQNVWYPVNEAKFSWNKQDKVTDFSYAVTKEPETDPGDESKGGDTSATFSNLSDGVHYFHIKARNNVGWGPVSHYTIKIDKTAPDPFGIAILEGEEDQVQIYFSSFDKTSGIDKYVVKVDGLVVENAKTGLKVAKTIGRVDVDAFDKAGNKRSAFLVVNEPEAVEVSEEEEAPATSVFDFRSALLAIIVIVLIQLILFGLYKLIKRSKDKAKKSETEAADAAAHTEMEKQALSSAAPQPPVSPPPVPAAPV